ncbi:cytochrome c oxidase subunit II [Vreelandella olivaria]|uniref:cytochrome c oxidase subunit II n=1 Tax=Vreelandella olivaria TaxID=390919 RepID=UPI00201F445B|nr:cytochrome c oxidase subunit II [Halomonas olivaria]
MRERASYMASPNIQRVSHQWVNQIAPLFVLVATTVLVGCAGDKSILDPAGQAARDVRLIWWIMLSFASVVFTAVIALWLYAFKRKPVERTPAEERRIARRWILGGGIILPVSSIAALLAFGVPAGQRMMPVPLDNAPEVIEVIGHQWWWEVRYPNAEGGEVVTANQIVMPAGEPVDFHVSSADVVHAFWIPRLGGKIDMLPGRVNRIRLEADEPGTLVAQSAEFSGVGYAHMSFPVEVLPRDEFDTWLSARQPEQLADLASQGNSNALAAFQESCASCHRVAGLSDSGEGPDLSDVGGRAALGAGVLPMQTGAITYWLTHHQTLKPGNRMPAHDDMDDATLETLGNWLEGLNP